MNSPMKPETNHSTYINISVYKFINLKSENLPALREGFRNKCLELQLKGSILLATEGVNAFVSGFTEQVAAFKTFMIETLGTSDLPFKDSPSTSQPFKRMLVKIKKEIITMGEPDIQPAEFTGKRVSAGEFKKWLDEGRDVVVIDTRNDYEVKTGTFERALDMNLQTFRQFPKKVAELPEELKEKTVVTFCTGGIRCEKATAYMARHGFKNVFQLDGGILRYFEEVGGSHYTGECFVFDYRVGVSPELKPTGSVLCFNCQMPVTTDEQKLESYRPGTSCPSCIDGKRVPHKEQIAIELKREKHEQN